MGVIYDDEEDVFDEASQVFFPGWWGSRVIGKHRVSGEREGGQVEICHMALTVISPRRYAISPSDSVVHGQRSLQPYSPGYSKDSFTRAL